MKLFSKFIAVVLVAAAAAVPAQAQFKLGVKAGVALNSIAKGGEMFSSDNRAGFTGGLMADFTVPVIGLGFDASVLYASRAIEYTGDNSEVIKKNRSYIDIPVNLKWKIGIPAVGKIITPFLTTGPDFSFLVSNKNMKGAVKNKSFDTAWNVGAGVQLLNKVQIAASYGIGLSKSVSGNDALNSGKNRCWTVTAAYLF